MAFQKLNFTPRDLKEIVQRSEDYLDLMKSRRSVRNFSNQPVPLEVLKNIVMTAASAPSGANKQPWKFIIVQDLDVKRRIRRAAEEEERSFYSRRATQEWLEDLNLLGTDWHKDFLEIAPGLIVVFKQVYDEKSKRRRKNYHVDESVGIACGFLLSAIHNAGLVALTYTPSPMGFLQDILKRPPNEKAYLVIPVGYPAKDAKVPRLTKKTFSEVADVI